MEASLPLYGLPSLFNRWRRAPLLIGSTYTMISGYVFGASALPLPNTRLNRPGFFIGNCFAFGWRLLNQEGAAFGILTDNSQADAVKRKGGTAPVAAVIACQQQSAIVHTRQFRSIAAGGNALGQSLFGLLTVNAQILHKAGEECGFEVRVALAWLPHRSVFLRSA